MLPPLPETGNTNRPRPLPTHRQKSLYGARQSKHRHIPLQRMPPLHLHILATDRATAGRIERALQAGDPGCNTQRLADPTALLQALTQSPGCGGIAVAPALSQALRHELNNQLAIIRMLSDILTEAPGLPPQHAAKAREIGLAAEAAAQAIRLAYTPISEIP